MILNSSVIDILSRLGNSKLSYRSEKTVNVFKDLLNNNLELKNTITHVDIITISDTSFNFRITILTKEGVISGFIAGNIAEKMEGSFLDIELLVYPNYLLMLFISILFSIALIISVMNNGVLIYILFSASISVFGWITILFTIVKTREVLNLYLETYLK